MTDAFTFTVAKTDGAARTGEIRMPRGVVRTPAFMPVGTAGTVKAMVPDQVKALGADIVLGDHPRPRVRTMKASYWNSLTCHHGSTSARKATIDS